MKSYVLIVLTTFALLLSGCNQSPDSSTVSHPNVPSSSASSQVLKVDKSGLNENFDVYQITGDKLTFSNIIKQNQIDSNYPKEMETTEDFIGVENKFLNIWKIELKNSVTKYTEMLSESDKIEFLQLQIQWEESTTNELNFEHNALDGHEYGISLGSSSRYLFLSQKREAYRQRTIRVKYLHYLLETAVSNPKSIHDCLSLKFTYNDHS